MMNVIEHCQDAVEIMHNAWLALRPGGIFIFAEEYSHPNSPTDPCVRFANFTSDGTEFVETWAASMQFTKTWPTNWIKLPQPTLNSMFRTEVMIVCQSKIKIAIPNVQQGEINLSLVCNKSSAFSWSLIAQSITAEEDMKDLNLNNNECDAFMITWTNCGKEEYPQTNHNQHGNRTITSEHMEYFNDKGIQDRYYNCMVCSCESQW